MHARTQVLEDLDNKKEWLTAATLMQRLPVEARTKLLNHMSASLAARVLQVRDMTQLPHGCRWNVQVCSMTQLHALLHHVAACVALAGAGARQYTEGHRPSVRARAGARWATAGARGRHVPPFQWDYDHGLSFGPFL